jgi:hypothetical protein
LFDYTPFDMLETYSVTGRRSGSVTTYRYDGGQRPRAAHRAVGDTAYMIHGSVGQLLAEYEETGTSARWVRDYVLLGRSWSRRFPPRSPPSRSIRGLLGS